MTSTTNQSKPTPSTIPAGFAASCRAFADQPALSFAFEPPITYAILDSKVGELAAALTRDGVGKGDRVAILAENSPQWGMAYLAASRQGAVVVPILPDFLEADVHHILRASPVKVLFTTQRQLEKICEFDKIGAVKVVTLDDSDGAREQVPVVLLHDYLAQAKAAGAVAPQVEVVPDDTASIIYTSGTSGHSKAVMLSHRNLTANVNSIQQVIDYEQNWTFLSILPMSHAYEFTVSFLLPIFNGMRIVYAGKTPTPTVLEKICQAERPNAICIVPMVMEKIYKKRIQAKIEGSRLLRAAMHLPPVRRGIYRKIGRKLLDFFGGELRIMGIGGAALNLEVEKFLHEAGFPYLVGYGLTEASPLLAVGPSNDRRIPLGSTGKPVPQVEIRIDHPDPETGIGEIMARGPNIMQGYFDNPAQTAETISEKGWLATGDLGFLDRRNYLTIKGRSKSVIVLASGENIYPEAIEEKINADIHAIESLVVESNNQLVALVHLDYALIGSETEGRSQQQQMEYIEEILKRIRTNTNHQLPMYSKITKVVERQEPFIKTATHKIKRYLYTRSS